MIQRSVARLMRGKYSSMMDMGGVAAVKTKTKLDFGKNNKVRAVALDFDLLTRSIEDVRQEQEQQEHERETKEAAMTETSHLRKDSKDREQKESNLFRENKIVQDIASLFHLDVKTLTKQSKSNSSNEEDDLSRLETNSTPSSTVRTLTPHRPKDLVNKTIKAPPPSIDIRSKYASKLSKKLNSAGASHTTPMGGHHHTGSAASIDMVKEELRKGDAGSHFHARTIAMKQSSSTNTKGSKWLASTGAGSLLSFLMSRSMKIILLPIPKTNMVSTMAPNNSSKNWENYIEEEAQRMMDLTKQLPNIQFDQLMEQGDTAESVLKKVATNLQSPNKNHPISTTTNTKEDHDDSIDPNYFMDHSIEILPKHCLVVSDRDDYLKMGKEGGMFTCRIRKENARRGNITAAYNCLEIGHVEDIVNEINGISFNSVFTR